MTESVKNSRIDKARVRFLSIGIMLFFSGAFYPYVLAQVGDINENANSRQLQILFSLIYFLCLLVGFSDFFNQRKIDYARHKLPLIFALFLVFSSVWSFDPAITFRNGIAYLGTIVLAITLQANSRSMNHLLHDLLIALRIGCISSLALAIGPGDYLGQNGLGFSGVFVHKNSFGAAMSLGVLLSLFFLIKMKSTFSIIWFALMLISLFLSNSTTSQVTALVGSLFLLLTSTLERSVVRDRLILITTFILFVLTIFLTFLAKNLTVNTISLSTTGKDATFTGRTRIWDVAINALDGAHLFFGYGYNAFWFSPESRSLNQYLVGFKNYNTHNGYLEILLSVGAIGLIFFLFLITRNVIESLKNSCFVIVLPLTVWFLVSNLTESVFITQNTLIPMLLVLLRPDRIKEGKLND